MEHSYLLIKHSQDNTISKGTIMDIYIQIIVIITKLIIKIINLMVKDNTLIKLEIIHLVVPTMEVLLIINKMVPKLIMTNLIIMIIDMAMLL